MPLRGQASCLCRHHCKSAFRTVILNSSQSSKSNSMKLGRGWISSAAACDRPGPKGCWGILLEVISLTASPGYSLAGECPEETKQLWGKDCLK